MSGEKFDNEQVERKEDNRLTKTEWEKIEIKKKLLMILKPGFLQEFTFQL